MQFIDKRDAHRSRIMSIIKADQSESFLKITARHDLALKLDLKKNGRDPCMGDFVLLDYPLLAKSIHGSKRDILKANRTKKSQSAATQTCISLEQLASETWTFLNLPSASLRESVFSLGKR